MNSLIYKVLNFHFSKQCGTSNLHLYTTIHVRVWVHQLCYSSSGSSFIYIHLYRRCKHYNITQCMTTTMSRRLSMQGASSLIESSALMPLLGSLRELGAPMRQMFQDHKRERERDHISIQNLKVLGKWVISFINPTLHSFIGDVTL